MARPHALLRGVLLSLATVVLFGTALEIGARVYLSRFASPEDFAEYASHRQLLTAARRDGTAPPRFTPHRYLGYYPTPGYVKGPNRHNSLGYRGDEIELPKPDGEFRVVCIGGSTTYTSHVPDYRDSYPHRLQQRLRELGRERVVVVNAGAGGWSTWESLINFELRVLDLEPDLVVVYHAINDVHLRLVWPPEAYRGDNSGAKVANLREVFMPSVLEYSTLARFFLVRGGWVRSHGSLRTIDAEAETFRAWEFRRQSADGSYPSGVFAEASARQMLAANPPRYFRRNLESLIAVAEGRGVAVVLATFAFHAAADHARISTEEYRAALLEMNDELRSIAAQTGVPLYDFAAEFPSDPSYFTDGRHVNERGARLKAEHFAAYLDGSGLIPF